MSSTGSGLLDLVTATINDKWTVEALKEYLRKRGGAVSGKKADLLENAEEQLVARRQIY